MFGFVVSIQWRKKTSVPLGEDPGFNNLSAWIIWLLIILFLWASPNPDPPHTHQSEHTSLQPLLVPASILGVARAQPLFKARYCSWGVQMLPMPGHWQLWAVKPSGWVTQDLHRWVIPGSSGKNTSIVQQSPEQLILFPRANCCPIKYVLFIDIVPQIPCDTSRSVKITSFINTSFSFFLSLSAPLPTYARGQGEPTSSTSL